MTKTCERNIKEDKPTTFKGFTNFFIYYKRLSQPSIKSYGHTTTNDEDFVMAMKERRTCQMTKNCVRYIK